MPVLFYHHVGPPGGGGRRFLSVDPERFESHVDWLARRRFTTVTPSAWLSGVRPRRPVMITFDDGYADLARHAFPVLARRGMTATAFVVTGLLGGQDEWNDELGGDRLQLLSREEIAAWAQRGIEFGAHGRTHRDLVLLDPVARAAEIDGSRSDLADALGSVPHAFAYPYGSYDSSTLDLVGRAFSLAFTTEEGFHRDTDDPLRVARIQVLSFDGALDLYLDVTFGSSLWNHLKRRLFLARQRLLARSRSSIGPRARRGTV